MAEKKSTKKLVSKGYSSMNLDDLKTELAKLQGDIIEAKQSSAAGELANPIVIREMRRNIARIKTEISKKNKEIAS